MRRPARNASAHARRCGWFLLVCLAWGPAARAQIPGAVAVRSMVEGRVVTQSNEPLRGVTLVLVDFNGADRRTAFSDDSGAFVFAGLRAGNYQIQASLPGFEPQSVRVDHDGERDFSLRIVLRPRSDRDAVAAPAVTAVWALRIPAAAREAYERGVAAMQQKRAKDARPHFTRAVELYPDYAAAHAALGSLALAEEGAQAARQAFTRALEIDAHLLDARLGLASLAIEKRLFLDAREHLLKARALKPDDWRILHQLGETEWQLRLYEAAEPNLRRAVELNPQSERTLLLLINVLALQEKWPQTLAAMDEFLARFPASSFAPQVRQKRDALKKQIGGTLLMPGGVLRG